MSKTTPTTEGTKLGIVDRILKILKMDDEGKVSKFFAKEVKYFQTQIRALKNNITSLTNVYDSSVETLNDKLEDAKQAVEDAYNAVTVENLVNNDAMEKFRVSYWANVNAAEKKVAAIEKEIEDAAKAQAEKLKDYNEQIARFESRIEKISAA